MGLGAGQKYPPNDFFRISPLRPAVPQPQFFLRAGGGARIVATVCRLRPKSQTLFSCTWTPYMFVCTWIPQLLAEVSRLKPGYPYWPLPLRTLFSGWHGSAANFPKFNFFPNLFDAPGMGLVIIW